MERRREVTAHEPYIRSVNHGPKMSVPQFGAWDSMDPEDTNFSVIFTNARNNKKQQKTDIKPLSLSLGNEREFLNATAHPRHHSHDHHHHRRHRHSHPQQDDPVVGRKKFLTYINCCIKP